VLRPATKEFGDFVNAHESWHLASGVALAAAPRSAHV
jgi:hypothetical protein